MCQCGVVCSQEATSTGCFRSLHVPAHFLYCQLGLNPMTMMAIPEQEVMSAINSMGGTILKVVTDQNAGPGIESRTYFVFS